MTERIGREAATARAVKKLGSAYKLAFGSATRNNAAYTAAGPVREILARFDIAENAMQGCPHALPVLSPGLSRAPMPSFLMWAAWRPELIMCAQCAGALLFKEGDEENFRCDGCGQLAEFLTSCSSIIPPEDDGFPPLVCHYAICKTCATLSNLAYDQ